MNDTDKLKIYINECLHFASEMCSKSKNDSDFKLWSGEIAAYNNVIDYIDEVIINEQN